MEERQMTWTRCQHEVGTTVQCESCGDRIPESDAKITTNRAGAEWITLAFCEGCA